MPEFATTVNMILYCKAWKKTVRFYRDGLHLPVHFSTDWFVEFTLNASSRLSVADEKHASIKSGAGRGMTFSLEVEDVQATWDDAKKNGLRPTGISPHPWNARVFYLFDPEGHRIEIWQPV